MYRVAIRYKSKKNNSMKSVYLQYNPPIRDVKGKMIRYEFLDLEVYETPKNLIQKQHNQTIEEVVETIKCERYLQLVRRDFSFLAKDNLDGDFIEYFRRNGDYHGKKYECARLHFEKFCNSECTFRDINTSFCEEYKLYLLKKKSFNKSSKLAHNTISSYYNVFLSIVKLAYNDNILNDDFTQYIRPITWEHNTQKEYLSKTEIQILGRTPYHKHPDLVKAGMFAIYTGLRRSDILTLRWENIVPRGKKHIYIEIKVMKTGQFIQLPLSKSALKVLGKRKKEGLVFPELTISILNIHLPIWLKLAGITKHITFHCFRHTFAMQLLEKGIDIYTISSLLGHKQVSSTQFYAKITSANMQKAIETMDRVD